MSLLADTAADLGGCGTEDVPSLTRQHTGEPRLRAVPKFPDSSLPFAAHLAVASCSHHHHHELLSRSAERAKTVSRAPRLPLHTWLLPPLQQLPLDTQQSTGPPENHSSFQGDFGLLPCCWLAPCSAQHMAGRRCQTKQDSSIYFCLLQPLKKTTPDLKISINKES